MNKKIETIIQESASAALATNGPNGLNVVPISVFEIHDGEIHLYDFFMNKTAENIQVEPKVSFTCWQGFVGLQIKAEAVYETEGEVFNAAVTAMKQQFPDRTLRAVIRLVPVSVYDVAPAAGGEELKD